MSIRTDSWIPLASLSLLLVHGLNAAALIDDFSLQSVEITTTGAPRPDYTSQTVTILGQDATRSIGVSAASGITQGQITGGNFGFVSEPSAGGQASLEYQDFSVNLSSTPFLRLDFASINFTGSMELALLSTFNPQTLGMVSPLTSGGPNSMFFDVRGFNGYQDGFLDGVTDVLLAFDGADGPFFAVRISKISFTDESEYRAAITAVPESGTSAWGAGGLLAGIALVQRARTRTRGCTRD